MLSRERTFVGGLNYNWDRTSLGQGRAADHRLAFTSKSIIMKVCYTDPRSIQFSRLHTHPAAMGQFGKEIQSSQVLGWSQSYLDYKGLKKVISALENSWKTAPDASGGALTPGDLLGVPPSPNDPPLQAFPPDAQAPISVSSAGLEDDRGPIFQAHKAAFFFKLERELEKVCLLQALVR